MPTTTRLTVPTRCQESTRRDGATLFLALELSERGWTLAFTTGRGQPPRVRKVAAGAVDALAAEIARARRRFGLAPTTPVVSCYEAGRDGFWVHRALLARGIANLVVDAASIEVNRRPRRAKTDRLDARKLVLMLVRWQEGERPVWHVVHVPSEADEDRRHLERERQTLVADHTRLLNRVSELLATQGVSLALTGDVRTRLATARRWDGTPLAPGLRTRLEREWARIEALRGALRALGSERHRRMTAAPASPADAPVLRTARRLVRVRGIGETLAWVLATELFGWRAFRNRRQVGGFVGLTPTPFQSGGGAREQGITRNGSRALRALVIELAWLWLRYQPESTLSQWYRRTYGGGSPRLRRIGIVALARKLLIALWRYVDFGEVPAGARLKDAGESAGAIDAA